MAKRDEIVVHVLDKKRKYLYYRWEDKEVPGRGGECSSGHTTKRQAYAGIPEFQDARIADRPRLEATWEAFCGRYEEEYLSKRKDATRSAWDVAKLHFDRIAGPKFLSEITYSMMSKFEARLLEKYAPSSVGTHLRTLRVALNEASRLFPDDFPEPPKIRVEESEVRGRPLEPDELETFLAAVETVVGPSLAPEWISLIHGAVYSGLRMGQLYRLSWDKSEPVRVQDIDGEYPAIFIAKDAHKRNRDQDKTYPMIVPMIELLRGIPKGHRKGRVFRPHTSRHGQKIEVNSETFGKVISRIGVASGIKTGKRLKHFKKDVRDGEGALLHRKGDVIEVDRHPTIHDLKKTFVTTALRAGLDLVEVSKLAQHKNTKTTERSYTPDVSQLGRRIQEVYGKPQQPGPEPPESDREGPDTLPFDRRRRA